MAFNESAKFTKNAYIGWTSTTGLHVPHDYDPDKIKKLNIKEKQKQKKLGTYKKDMMTMSMIIPFTFVCNSCGQFNYIGKKLNFKVEPVKGESHLGVRIYRFYGKCKRAVLSC